MQKTSHSRPRALARCRQASRMVQAKKAHFRPEGLSDRGDVPGWVLITLMTAGLVAVLWAVAGPTLTDLFTSAIEGVTGG